MTLFVSHDWLYALALWSCGCFSAVSVYRGSTEVFINPLLFKTNFLPFKWGKPDAFCSQFFSVCEHPAFSSSLNGFLVSFLQTSVRETVASVFLTLSHFKDCSESFSSKGVPHSSWCQHCLSVLELSHAFVWGFGQMYWLQREVWSVRRFSRLRDVLQQLLVDSIACLTRSQVFYPTLMLEYQYDFFIDSDSNKRWSV